MDNLVSYSSFGIAGYLYKNLKKPFRERCSIELAGQLVLGWNTFEEEVRRASVGL